MLSHTRVPFVGSVTPIPSKGCAATGTAGAGDPMVGVVPGWWAGRRWLGRVLGVRRMDGVGGVEVGVESQRVVGVALQRADAVVMNASARVSLMA